MIVQTPNGATGDEKTVTPTTDQRERMLWHVRVRPRTKALDGHGREVLADTHEIGLKHVEAVTSSRLYFFSGSIDAEDIRLLGEQLLCDPVAEVCTFGGGLTDRNDALPAIEVHLQPGVMNPVVESTLGAARRLLRQHNGGGNATIEDVRTARRYEFAGRTSAAELDQIAARLLANGCIENYYIQGCGRADALPESFPTPPTRPFAIRRVPLGALSDEELNKLSRTGHLFLSLPEMRTIQKHFQALKREPTDLELETLAQTWSEHCVHKTLKSAVDYEGDGFGDPKPVRLQFQNLLKETIVATTMQLNRDWCLSVFEDNAGIIAFDEEYGIAFKAETHNHPSAIEPYGGAATGVGGCIRDIMGCGLGAKPIASTDVFCLAPPDFDAAKLPKDVLHPRRVLKGVVGGVRDYGNRMGIPTVNGAIYFDERYLANPLVFCGSIVLIPRNRIGKAAHAGDFIVVAGGRTGRDGIHGATFSSAELTDTHADEFSHAVQIGNAIEEKKLLDAMLIARDHPDGCLYSAVTDCGAGGLSSAVGEMGAQLGAVVDLEKVPLKYSGLRYDEIWISEAQERMVFAVPPDRVEKMLALFAAEEVDATVIGSFTGDGKLLARFRGETVGELDMHFLHEGLPKAVRTARWTKAEWDARPQAARQGGASQWRNAAALESGLADRLLTALRHPNIASKEWVIRQYDHEVQGRSVVKPLVGPMSGPSDAAVLRPRYDQTRGIAIGCGLCPHLSDVDPYVMAIAAVDEALRNVICVGADPVRTAILDNFCWPKVDSELSMGALVRACRGASDAALAYGLPFISGKDSLNNEFSMSEAEARRTGLPQRIAILPTLLISALGIVSDVRRCVTMDLKEAGNVLVLATAPIESVGLTKAKALHDQVSAWIQAGEVRSAHDVSDGGLAVAVGEMCIASGLGATLDTAFLTSGGEAFREKTATYVLEMSPAHARQSGLRVLGAVQTSANLLWTHQTGSDEVPVASLDAAWRTPLHQGGGHSA